MALRLYNTATRKLEDFTPLHPPQVTMYNCGPTVYNYVHIGNLRPYVFADILRRTLEASGYAVEQIVNITDVGHLTGDNEGDANVGEDRMEKGAAREGKNVEEIVAMYSDAFFSDLALLNIETAKAYPRATLHIAEQIALIRVLEEKGFTYVIGDGVYFDSAKFADYGKLARLDIAGLREGARVEANSEKRGPTDFALWKFSPSESARLQEWESPWGRGFPGWHLECSAMAMKYLGETIDIHTGGVDHIPVHHTNEIAQSECATGKQFVRYWLHCAHMTVEGEKMSKSLGNTFLLSNLHERGIPPLAYRYWLLTAHYRTQINFTWEALAAAQSAFSKLTNHLYQWTDTAGGTPIPSYMDEFNAAIDDDLNTASAIALLWKLIKETNYGEGDKYATLEEFDKVLGLGLTEITEKPALVVPPEVRTLLDARETARTQKDWKESDRLRDEVRDLGFNIKDTGGAQHLEKI